MTFKVDFEKFLQYWNNSNYIFLARPTQTLIEHIANMLTEMEDYFLLNPPFLHKFRNLLYLGGYISVLAHDFGKLLPHFQYKLYKKQKGRNIAPIPEDKQKYSYHSLIGALFSYCLCKQYEKHISETIFQDFLENQNIEIQKDLAKYLKYFCFEAIVSHHAPYIVNNFDEVSYIYDDNDFNKIFSYLKTLYPRLMEFFSELMIAIEKRRSYLKYEQGKKSSIPLFNTRDLLELVKKGLKSFEKRFLSKISNNNDEENDDKEDINPFKLEISDEINSIKEKLYKIQEIKEDIINPIEKYVIQTYVSSLLCDLDIWDARFHNSDADKENLGTDHSLQFYHVNKSLKDYQIIENFVSKPFGNLDKNFTNFQAQESENIMNLLRNKLFLEANKDDMEIGKIYSLNAPTGSGKTLTLLNKAIQTLSKYQNELNYPPKIIYCLPFISIGTQVASQIQDIFLRDKSLKKLVNSPLLTIDNYISEAIWNFGEEYSKSSANTIFNEEKKTIYGGDAKWLISTWRSQFIVTTFVKLFHSLLKPTKKNYLRFHRIANSIIILDEVQCLPIGYWDIIKVILICFNQLLNCTIFLSTATQPALMDLSHQTPIAEKYLSEPVQMNQNKDHATIHESLNRYTLRFFPESIPLDEFIQKFKSYLKNSKKDLLFVVNTKSTAIDLFLELKKENLPNTDLQVLSTLVLPVDRKKIIKQIKKKLIGRREKKEKVNRQIVISTQVVEAGVDFSFPVVFRDFAPLDSIIQIAGRCNRGLEYERGIFYLFKLKQDNTENKLFFHKIYKSSGVYRITNKYLKEFNNTTKKNEYFGNYLKIDEPELRLKFQHYFQEIRNANLTEMLLEDLKNQNYYKLSTHFNLLEGYPNQVIVYLPINQNAQSIHQKYQNKNVKHLIGEFYLYTITLDIKLVKKLISMNIIHENTSKKNQLIYYYIKPEDIPNWYSKETGFIYTMNNGEVT